MYSETSKSRILSDAEIISITIREGVYFSNGSVYKKHVSYSWFSRKHPLFKGICYLVVSVRRGFNVYVFLYIYNTASDLLSHIRLSSLLFTNIMPAQNGEILLLLNTHHKKH